MKEISVREFKDVIASQQGGEEVDFINVCTPAEFKECHIEGVRNVPMNDLAARLSELDDKSKVYVHCRSGARACKAINQLTDLGVKAELINIRGGLEAWTEAGFATKQNGKGIPLTRQVMLTAGLLVLIGCVLSVTVDPRFIWLSAFVGAGLTFAGLTGWCGLMFLLARMPWNK